MFKGIAGHFLLQKNSLPWFGSFSFFADILNFWGQHPLIYEVLQHQCWTCFELHLLTSSRVSPASHKINQIIPRRASLSYGFIIIHFTLNIKKKGVPSAESSRSVRGLGNGVSGKPYPRLCNARRPRLEPGTFRSQAWWSKMMEKEPLINPNSIQPSSPLD